MSPYFNIVQLPLANKAFNDAEKLVARHFRLSEGQLKRNKYDVKTLAYLDQHEIKDGALPIFANILTVSLMAWLKTGKTVLIFTGCACRIISFWTR